MIQFGTITGGRRTTRRLLQQDMVKFGIAATIPEGGSLSLDAINAALAKRGLPQAVLLSDDGQPGKTTSIAATPAPSSSISPSTSTKFIPDADEGLDIRLIVSAAAGAIFLAVCTVSVLFVRHKRAEKGVDRSIHGDLEGAGGGGMANLVYVSSDQVPASQRNSQMLKVEMPPDETSSDSSGKVCPIAQSFEGNETRVASTDPGASEAVKGALHKSTRVQTDISPHANGKSGVVSRSPNAFATADLAMEMRPPLPRPFSASELQQHPARSSLLHHQIAALQEEVAQLEADLHRLLPASGSAGRISSCQSEPPMTSPQGTVDLSERQLNEAKQDRNGRKAGRMAREVTRSTDLTVDLVLVDGTPVLADGIGRPRSASATEALPSAPSAENSDVARRTLMCLENIMAKPGAPLRAIQRAAGFTEMRKLINSHVPNLDATELRRLFDECDTDQDGKVSVEEFAAGLRKQIEVSSREQRLSAEDGVERNVGLFSWLVPSAQWWSPLRAAEDGKEELVLTI